MTRDPSLLLNDILESIGRIEAYTRGLDEEEFADDARTQDAVIRRFEIIGEAVKALPNEITSANPDVRWSDIAGLRDVLIHGYHLVNVHRVWRIIEDDLDGLKATVSRIVDENVSEAES